MLNSEALAEYKAGIDFFYLEQLVPLNASIFIVEKIFRFPFKLFVVSPEDTIFFNLVIENFYYAGLLTITRLATDQGKDWHTLTQFKNWVLENVKPEYKTAFQNHLKQARFDKNTRALFEKAKRLRDTRIAHIHKNRKILEEDQLNFEELKELRDALNSLLDILSFNVDSLMLPIQYHPDVIHPPGSDSRSDIERILDNLAKDSHILNSPEKKSPFLVSFS